ncbi:Zinc import ATP-binding protein ZnuC [compost metagenome]
MPTSPETPVVEASGLLVGYQGRAVLPPLSFAIQPGELWVLAGRNGSGKSTLLKTILGLLAPVGGSLGRAPGASIAYLPQRQALDPIVPMRARDIVAEGVEAGWSFLKPWLGKEEKARIREAMAFTSTEALAERNFTELSEGQKQRVLLARALAARPQLMLLDEPTSAMDLTAEQEAIELLDRLRKQLNTAVLLVSHHLPTAVKAADQVLFVDAEHQKALVGPVSTVAADPTFRRQFAGLTGELKPLDPQAREERSPNA